MFAPFFIKRLLLLVPTLFGVLVVVFVLLRVAPGDPIAMMVGPGATPDDIAQLRRLYGLDGSILGQFGIYIGDALQGHFGDSISLKRPVVDLIASRLPVTLELALLALLFAVTLGGTLALLATRYMGGVIEHGINTLTGFIMAIPDFLWGLSGILVFGVLLPVMPIFGLLDSELRFQSHSGFMLFESLLRGQFEVAASIFMHLCLPALALALPLAALICGVLRSSLKEVMAQDYILLAQVKGFAPWRILLGESLRNAVIPALTLTGVQFTFLIGGTVLIEKIFGLPGVGSLAIDAVINRDLPLIQGVVLTFALLFTSVNIIIDALNALLNPRLRHGAA